MQKLTGMTPYILLAWCLWVISTSAQAVEVAGLYEAELAVTGQGRTERQEIVRAALLEVLVKVSGNTNVALSPGIPQLLKRRNQFLQQYRYRAETSGTATALNKQYLWVRFDKQSLDSAMRNLDLAVWGRSRPSTLAWIAVEQGGKRQLLNSGTSTNLSEIILQRAKQRGIPLDFPLLDLEDQQKIGVTDVLGGFQETILKASQRYSADAILVGRLRQLVNQRWQGRWTLNLAGREFNWSEEGDFDAIIGFGIDGVTSTLASNYSSTSSNVAGEVKVLVTDIFNLDDYARSDQFLAGLDGVMRVEPEKIEKQSILFKVHLRGDQQSLLQAVRLSSQSIFTAVETLPTVQTTPVVVTAETTPDGATIEPVKKVVTVPALRFKLIP